MVVAVGTGQTAIAGLTRVQVLLTAAGRRARVRVAVPANFMRFTRAGAAYRKPCISDGGFGW